MKAALTDWDRDAPVDLEEAYKALVRSLRRRRGFGLLFVHGSPASGERVIARVKKDLPQKRIEVLELKEGVDNFYNLVEEFPNIEKVNILFVTGIEYSLYEYEEEKRERGWESKDIYSYSWKGVPRILRNLNQQRERFRDNFNVCFVFILPRFVIDYINERAPDFFDWRSGLFKVSRNTEILAAGADLLDCLNLTDAERGVKIREITALLKDSSQAEKKANLFYQQGLLLTSAKRYSEAIASYDKAIEIKPDYHLAWYNRGYALDDLERYSEVIASYDKAIEIKPNLYSAWYNRGNALRKLSRDEEAIASYDKAIEIKPDDHEAWNNRGKALDELSRYSEAIASYDKAIEIKPDLHSVWYNRGKALYKLSRYSEAIASYDKAIEIKPNLYSAWYNRGYALYKLLRYSEAIASYDKAIEIKPNFYEAWYNRGNALRKLSRYEEAMVSYQGSLEPPPFIALDELLRYSEATASGSYDKAIEIKPDDHDAWYNRGKALGDLSRYEEAIASYDKAIEIKADYHYAWYNRGYALYKLLRYEEAIASYDKAIEIKPDLHEAWHKRGNVLFHLSRYEDAIASYDKAIEIKADYHLAWNNRGKALSDLQQVIDRE